MQYTKFGQNGPQVSRLGFGCMRLPSLEQDGKTVYDEEESARIINQAIDLGVNYLDTAPGYCGGESERILGQAVQGRRDRVLISTKYRPESASADDYERGLEQSLQKLNTDYLDFHHFWGITLEEFEQKIRVPGGPWERALRLQQQGLIRHLSFSFHDEPGNLAEIIRRSEGAFCSVLCQYNLLDQTLAADMAFAQEQGLGVAVMGPVGGGRLGAPSAVIQGLLPDVRQSSAAVALRFVLSNPHVSLALSGMGSAQMVAENAAIAADHRPLTAQEQERIQAMMAENERLAGLYCTGCNYCMPCPAGLNIPELFTLMNLHRVYGLTDFAREAYGQIGKLPWMQYENADTCTGCAACEAKCPQKLPIREQLQQTHAVLG